MGVQRTVFRGLPLAFLIFAFTAPASAAATIGLYTDEYGSSCSFAGNQAGIVNAYVIVKPDNLGIRGVRFSAPVPACFGGSWISDSAPFGAAFIGDSPSDISVAFANCAIEPAYALQIQYLRNSTTACCAFPIAPNQLTGVIEGTTCTYDQASMVPVMSHFNANASCACSDPNPPHPPEDPVPANSATLVSMTTPLSWSKSPFDSDIASYDVFLGTTTPPPFVANVTATTYQPPQALQEGTLYYWKIVVHDIEGYEATGPIWAFTTRLTNYPPNPPSNPVPSNNMTGVAINTTLAWAASDPDNETLAFDVYFGTTSPPPLVAANSPYATYALTGLTYGVSYRWKVVARDPHGAQTSSQEWMFTTRPANYPPSAPTAQYPTQNLVNVPVNSVLSWQCSDPDGDALVYDVYFGTSSPPPLLAQDIAVKSFAPAGMAFNTVYYWKIVARDVMGAQATSSLYVFSTGSNSAPSTPTNPSPANGATAVALNATLSWTATDDQPGLKYNVYFGTTTTPPLVAADHSSNTFDPGPLSPTTQYRWKISARDANGAVTTGPLWTFYTVSPPSAFNPSPADNGFGASPLNLVWTCNQPNSQPVHCDVYFGTTNPPPLVASAVGPTGSATSFTYAPAGSITLGTVYYWHINTYDAFGGTVGPVWKFTGSQKGDIDRDGFITLTDASCALQIALGNIACATAATTSLADVNCAVGVTPRDALCIHRRAIGQTCLFCGESETAGATTGPVVTRSAYWQTGNNIYVNLAVSGVPTFEAWSFQLRTPTNAPLTMVTPVGLTTGFTALTYTSLSSSMFRVGGYTLTAGDGSATTDFIQLRFTVSGSMTGFIVAETFIDDLYGAASMTLISGNGKGGGGETPVTFSHFDATPDEGGVRIAWAMRFVDVAESYTLYRHENEKTPLAIASGAVHGATGSYLDRTVEVGKTYQYEMLVRSTAGEDVRSQLITVTVPTRGLALGPNHPNPFNPQTTIPYFVPAADGQARVRVIIYDTSGRAVRVLVNEDQAGGAHDVVWRGNDETGAVVSSGIYFCVLQVGNERRTQKLVLLK
jgi:hypothetical protein